MEIMISEENHFIHFQDVIRLKHSLKLVQSDNGKKVEGIDTEGSLALMVLINDWLIHTRPCPTLWVCRSGRNIVVATQSMLNSEYFASNWN